MSRRGRNSAGTVSLFPFLAVLVCAMGALILLLLVTTRRIRQQALQEAVPASESAAVEAVPIAAPAIDSTLVTLPPTSVSQVPPAGDDPIEPLLAGDPPPEPVDDQTPRLLAQIAALEAEQAAVVAEVADLRRQLDDLKVAAATASSNVTNLAAASKAYDDEKSRLNGLSVRLREQEQEISRRVEDLRAQVRNIQSKAAKADSQFAIIPYDGASGTNRRPIFIECRSDRIVFVSEGISLGGADLNGFTARYNPLLYVTHALIRFWERRDRQNPDEELGEPYVLLVVRPDGIPAYSIARGLLSGLQQPFGYELVTADQEFRWPAGDPEAADICRILVENMLTQRDLQLPLALRSGVKLPRITDPDGRYLLERGEDRQETARDLRVNGQRFGRRSVSGETLLGSGSGRSSDRTRPTDLDAGTETSRNTPFAGLSGVTDVARKTPPAGSARTAQSGVHTTQSSAITEDERLAEWLRDGTRRLPATSGSRSPDAKPEARRRTDGGTAQVNPFAEEKKTLAKESGAVPDSPRDGLASGPMSSPPQNSAGHASEPTTLAPPTPQPEMLTFRGTTQKEDPPIDPVQPRWGVRSADGTIGFEREVRVEIKAGQIRIGDDTAFGYDGSLTPIELRRLMASAINREVRSWGQPPRSFYWVPSLRFVIAPGERVTYERLKPIAESWKLRMSVEQVSESLQRAGAPHQKR